MGTGIDFFSNTQAYCRMCILFEECKWWEFSKKKTFRGERDWWYPLMKSEIKLLNEKE